MALRKHSSAATNAATYTVISHESPELGDIEEALAVEPSTSTMRAAAAAAAAASEGGSAPACNKASESLSHHDERPEFELGAVPAKGKGHAHAPRPPQRQRARKTRRSPVTRGAVLLLLNSVCALACIFVNRKLMSPPLGFTFPITLTLIGYVSSVLGLSLCRRLGLLKATPTQGRGRATGQQTLLVNGRHNHRPVHGGGGFRGSGGPGSAAAATASAGRRRRVPWSLVVTTAGAPLLANYSLLLNSVGVYQLSKVLVTPSILWFAHLRGAPPLSLARAAALAVVSLGVCVVTLGDVALNRFGTATAALNVLVAGYYKVEWSFTCRSQGISSATLMAAVMPPAAALLAAAALFVEGPDLARYHAPGAAASSLGLLLALGGLAGFLTSWTGYVVIANLSALTHQLLGQAKTCAILLAAALLGSPLSSTQAYGASLAMTAMGAYTHLSLAETARTTTTKAAGGQRSAFGGQGRGAAPSDMRGSGYGGWAKPSPSGASGGARMRRGAHGGGGGAFIC